MLAITCVNPLTCDVQKKQKQSALDSECELGKKSVVGGAEVSLPDDADEFG